MILLINSGCAAMRNPVYVNLQVEDDQGNPIPYVTVWGYVLPRDSPLALNSDDLWRQTFRYQSTFDLVTSDSGNKPVRTMRVYEMSNADGECKYKIDYFDIEGTSAKIPEVLYVGFTVMKRGYFPERIDFKFTDENNATAKIVMRRNTQYQMKNEPYLSEFDKIRYELSDNRRNEEISVENDARLKGIRSRLENLARKAEANGADVMAARIYARMTHLPYVIYYNGKPAGYSRADPNQNSSETIMLLEKAYSLDKNNPYIVARYEFRKMSDIYFNKRKSIYSYKTATEVERKEYMSQLEELKILMKKHGEEIWPTYHSLFAHRLKDSSEQIDREKSVQLLEEFKRWEPKYR